MKKIIIIVGISLICLTFFQNKTQSTTNFVGSGKGFEVYRVVNNSGNDLYVVRSTDGSPVSITK